MNLPRVPAGVVAITEEVLLSGFLVLLSGEDADGEGDQNEERLHLRRGRVKYKFTNTVNIYLQM